MYKIIHSLTLASVAIALIGCGGGSSNSSTSSTTESGIPSSLPSGTNLSVNPEISFTSELSVGFPATANYENTDSSSAFFVGSEQVTVNLEQSSTSLTVSFTLSNGDKVEFILRDFIDLGETGYFDEFTAIAKVNGETKLTQVGQFLGTTKPRNPKVSNAIDINRPPTEEEFDKYLVGKPIWGEETYPNPGDDAQFIVFHADGSFSEYEANGTKESSDDDDRWDYFYNGGKPYIKASHTHSSGGTHSYRAYFHFTNFFEGTYEDIDEDDEGTITPKNSRGNWKVYNAVFDRTK